jgi:nitrogen fixation NifU-like protein
MSEPYNAKVLDHFTNPRNVGEIEQPDAIATVSNPGCGDTVRLTLRIRGGRIEDARMKTFGCAAAIASASVLTELLRGRSVEDARRLRNEDVVSALGGLPPEKVRCSVLAEEVLRAALERVR